jgi:hypothetical protein
LITVLDELMEGQDGVVGFHNGVCYDTRKQFS